MTQTGRDGAHFRSLARQVALAPIQAAVRRNKNSLLRCDINRRLRARTKTERNVTRGRGKREATYCPSAGHRDRVRASQKQGPCPRRRKRVYPNPARSLRQAHLLLPTLSVVARNKKRGTFLRASSSIKNL